MRMIAMAAVLFAVAFGVVAAGQKAFGIYRLHQSATSSAHRPATDASKAKAYSDYLRDAQIAYRRMNLTCSTAHRKAFGRSFHQLLAATRALRAGVIVPGDLRPAAVSDLIGASPDALLFEAAMSSELTVFAEAFDATQRGVLTDADLPPGLTTLMEMQLTNARADASRNADPLAAMKVKLPTYCQPL